MIRALALLRRAQSGGTRSLFVFARELGRGVVDFSHNTLALVGLAAVVMLALALGRADLRDQIETKALGWLQERQEQRDPAGTDVLQDVAEPTGVARATAADLADLTRPQATLANWIARRYKVAPQPVGALVQEAWSLGKRVGLDPTLILAVMAIESSFNPFAQSNVGAQGLMQVLSRVHVDKYRAFGGTNAAFDPISNLRVGVLVLKECISRAGSLSEGLRYYVGAALLGDDGGYVGRVMAEQQYMRSVADGRHVPVNATPAAALAGSRDNEARAAAASPVAPTPAAAPRPEPAAQLALLD